MVLILVQNQQSWLMTPCKVSQFIQESIVLRGIFVIIDTSEYGKLMTVSKKRSTKPLNTPFISPKWNDQNTRVKRSKHSG